MRLTRRPRHQADPRRTATWLDEPDLVSRLAAELTLELGCPVEVSYLKDTREVVAVARVDQCREIQVILPVSLLGLGLVDLPYTALKYDVLKQLRRQMNQGTIDG